MDLCSITQGGKKSLSFLAQSLGLMADLDFGKQSLLYAYYPAHYVQGPNIFDGWEKRVSCTDSSKA